MGRARAGHRRRRPGRGGGCRAAAPLRVVVVGADAGGSDGRAGRGRRRLAARGRAGCRAGHLPADRAGPGGRTRSPRRWTAPTEPRWWRWSAGAAAPAPRCWRRRSRCGRPARASTLLVDLDPLGGGLDLLLGAERLAGLRWPDLAGARGRLGGGMLRDALPRLDGLSLLSWAGGPAPSRSRPRRRRRSPTAPARVRRGGPGPAPGAGPGAARLAAVDRRRAGRGAWPTVRPSPPRSGSSAPLDPPVADLRAVVRGPGGPAGRRAR